jgi:hypothetical protein
LQSLSVIGRISASIMFVRRHEVAMELVT